MSLFSQQTRFRYVSDKLIEIVNMQ